MKRQLSTTAMSPARHGIGAVISSAIALISSTSASGIGLPPANIGRLFEADVEALLAAVPLVLGEMGVELRAG